MNKNALEPSDKDFILYDVEVNINSILDIIKGWEITFTKEGKKRFENAKEISMKIISVIGNKNRGKSFVLSKISNKNLPRGFNVTTKGISISFPDYGNIAVLDSAGLESPLLEDDSEQYRLKSKDEKYKSFYEESKELKNEINEKKNNNASLNEIKILENLFFKKKNEFYDSIKDKDDQIESLSNERKITDFFLQRFIIENANIILLVVEKLSIDDQFFLNKITKLIKEIKTIFSQKIIVIHNIKKMKNKKDVENYIDNTLKKSLTFSLHQEEKQKLDSLEDYNKFVYIEKDDNDSNEPIIHIIMAQEGSEAGNYYNKAAIEFIKSQAETYRNIKEFDLEERLRSFFCSVSETIFKFENENEKIKPEDIKLEISQDNDLSEKITGKIILDYNKNISLENFYGEFFTDSFGEGRFCPDYYIDSSDDEKVNIYLDCPGTIKITNAQINKNSLIINGRREKSNNNIKTMGRKFCSGDFELKIILEGKDIFIDYEEQIRVHDLKNGFFLVQLKREKNNE